MANIVSPREWMLTQLAFGGQKKRIKRGLQVIDAAMEAMKDDPEDHKTRLSAAGFVISIYGLDSPKQSNVMVSGDPDSPLQLTSVDRRYIEQVIQDTVFDPTGH